VHSALPQWLRKLARPGKKARKASTSFWLPTQFTDYGGDAFFPALASREAKENEPGFPEEVGWILALSSVSRDDEPLQTVLFVCFDCESVVEFPANNVGFVNLLRKLSKYL
jgi:hypothetical protein